MADLSYSVDIDTRGAANAIQGLGNTIRAVGASIAGAFAFKEVTTTGAKFDDLRRTFQTLYRDLETGNQAFNETKQLASQLGIGIDELSTTVIKLKSAGIEPTVSTLTLFGDIAASSVDKVGALQAITDLFTRTMAGGLGLEDLERLQDRGIPVYTILAEKAGIARSQISELGQTMEGAARIRGVLAEGLNEMFGGATQARADSLSTSFTNLQNAIQSSSDTIIQGGLGQALADVINSLAKWIDNNQRLIAQISGGLAKAMEILVNNLGVITSAARIFFTVMTAQKILAITKAFINMSKALIRNPIMLVAVAAVVAAEKLGLLEEAMDKVSESIGDALGLDALGAEFDALQAEIESASATGEEFGVIMQGSIAKANSNFDDLNQSLNKFKVEQELVVANFRDQNIERQNAIVLETKLLGQSREYGALKRAEVEITNELNAEIRKLQEQKLKLTEQEKAEGRAEVIDNTISKLRAQAQVEQEFTKVVIEESEARKVAYEIEQYAMRERTRQSRLAMDMYDARARLSMNALEKEYHDIEAAARDSYNAQVDVMEASLGRNLTHEESNELYRIAQRNTEALKNQAKELYDESRRFSTGWKKAFNDYADEATNAARTAERVFEKTTQGMEDAIVNFAKTGKFEWRGFVNSIVEELLRSQIRQLIASTFGGLGSIFTPGGGIGGGGGGGSIFSGIGKLFSGFFANGGMIPAGTFGVVGERGPELVSGPATVTPMGQTTNVVYNINAVDALSFKQMVARDPSFIHAVAVQGGKSIPQTRR